MQFKNFSNAILLVISMSSMASAHLIPGPPGGGGRPYPYPGSGGGLSPAPHPGHPHGPPPGLQPRPPRPMPPMPPRPLPPRPLPPRPPAPPYYPPQPPPNYPPNPGYGTELKRIYLNRQVVNETIDLRAYAGLGYNYSGAEIVSVRANVRSSGYRTIAQLQVDGRIVATQMDASNNIVLYPQSRVLLDQSARNVMLVLSGSVYVDTIDIEVRGGGYQQPGGNVDIPVYRSVFGNDRIDLTSLVDLSRYRGLRIQQVIVTATARYGSAAVSLLINGFNAGNLQFTGGYSQRQDLWLSGQPMIGSGADSLVLYTSGDMTVENVTLVVR